MTAVLRTKTYLDFKVSGEIFTHAYFKTVEAQFWQLKHYLSFRLKTDQVILPWNTVYNDWQRSLNLIENNSRKRLPVCITSFCKDLLEICETFEGFTIKQKCEEWYSEFYQRNLDKQLVERIRELDATIFSERKYSELYRNASNKPLIEDNGETSSSSRNETELATDQSQEHTTNFQHQDLHNPCPSQYGVQSKIIGTTKGKKRGGYSTPCPIMEDDIKDKPRSKRRALSHTDDGSNYDSYKIYDESDKHYESEESDDEYENELRLNIDDIGFEEYIDQRNEPFIFKTKDISSLFESYRSKALSLAQNYGLLVTKNYHEILSLSHILLLQADNYSDMQVKTFSRDILEDLRRDIKSRFIGKEKVSRDIKSLLQEYIEIALDNDDGGLCELRKTIINSFSKTSDSTTEEFFQRMLFLFQHLSYTIPLRSLKEKLSEGTLVANIISPILRIFLHDAYIYPTIWPNTSSASSKTRKLAVGDPTRAKQPDMIGNIVNNGKFAYEVIYGEVTGEGKNNTEKKNLIDLIRLGIFMKDSLDNLLLNTGVNRVFAWQVIVTKWTGYLMTLICPGIYVMIDTGGSVKLPRSFESCNMFLSGLDTLHAFQLAYEGTVKEILLKMNKKEESENEETSNDNFKTWHRQTLGTPAFKRIVRFK